MAEESISISKGHSKVIIRMFWSKTWCDMLIQEDVGGETVARIMITPNVETLRSIADQLYQWADTVEERDIEAEKNITS